MDTFAAVADERRGLADLLAGLTPAQQVVPSLCGSWRVHDVLAHLVMPLQVSLPRFALTMVACRGDFDRANDRLTRAQARTPFDELVVILRRKADSRFTPPGSGPEAPLADLLVHGSDIRRPLGLTRDIPPERSAAALTFLTGRPGAAFVARGTTTGLRFEAADLEWSHGDGPVVRGPADALLLALTGRQAAPDVTGDGVAILRSRLP
ncbi:maleylpyruvate isomerase family mycothiol-dependent enzyme [Nakamurella flavida]|uniref:Maleylpyruvate isomerase family mycothiol-dependent enzyme n=1 Tax=Nakamurella flavida TaxID=363630 RepID=A0A938YHY2_9ACTN|nr:maleylpyruvate isomerase family mycothiol-dependent enzyme [Nakamurella flavida]MBM9475434.1 maleylpyruvate isomerase family mycothiol-dependent enzyme [Nakamurella flavida]MBM9475478.1 maleylpyruvate isomerase family mycothiol-dependent enzyme [Nakamurella flavida]MDP9777014.1 uncharacterized protein (TIGR03083 family) [Nakamurella flavida]